MRIGILKTDRVPPELSAVHGQYPDMFAAALGRVREDWDFTDYDVQHLQYPVRPGDCDGYVVTGSKHAVYDELPWISRLGDFLRRCADSGIRVAGVCFGHQMIAQTFGGRVARAAGGWTAGVQECSLHRTPSFADADAGQADIRLIHSHRDQVLELPPGAELLAGNDACPIAMQLLDGVVFGSQGHPEFTPGFARALYDLRREQLGDELHRRAHASLEGSDDDARRISGWVARFFEAGG